MLLSSLKYGSTKTEKELQEIYRNNMNHFPSKNHKINELIKQQASERFEVDKTIYEKVKIFGQLTTATILHKSR